MPQYNKLPMIIPKGKEKLPYMRRLFGRVAQNYDFMNRLMTFGQDLRWRSEAIRQLDIQPGQRILDAGAGTGDISLEISNRYPQTQLVACDLTPEMIAVGKKRPGGNQLNWVIADAQYLPFQTAAFDGVISAFLIRNVPDLIACLQEQHRVLSQGMKMVALETSPPGCGLMLPLIKFYLRVIIPLLGKILLKDAEPYMYLPQSTEEFLPAAQLAERLRMLGFDQVNYVCRMFGTMAIHQGRKIKSPTIPG